MTRYFSMESMQEAGITFTDDQIAVVKDNPLQSFVNWTKHVSGKQIIRGYVLMIRRPHKNKVSPYRAENGSIMVYNSIMSVITIMDVLTQSGAYLDMKPIEVFVTLTDDQAAVWGGEE